MSTALGTVRNDVYEGRSTNTEDFPAFFGHDEVGTRFVSVDPAVSSTLQAYGYANEDPLNLSDPSGLEVLKSVVQQEDAAAARCKANPHANGCRGLDLGVDLIKAAVLTGAVIGGAVCVAATAGTCGAAAFTMGGIEFSGGAIAVGIATGAAEGATDYALSPGKHSAQGFVKSAAFDAVSDALYVGVLEEALFGGLGEGSHAAQLTWSEALRYLPRYLLSAFK